MITQNHQYADKKMTELSPINDDDYLVVVNAQVMIRDENKGGWVPLGRGGLSRVGLRRRLLRSRCATESHHEYRIHGILDQSEVLNCLLTKDVNYYIANPTFIHWHIGEKKFGLTFQSHGEAKAFERGVQQVVEDLLQGMPDKNANTCIHHFQSPNPQHTHQQNRQHNRQHYQHPPYHSRRNNFNHVGEEDDVLMAIELPQRRRGSGSTVSTITTTTTSTPQSPALQSLHDSLQSPTHMPSLDRAPVDEPVMHKVVYMNPPGRQSGSNNSSTKSQSSVFSDTSSGLPDHVLIRKENQANERARQLSLHGFAIEKGHDEIDLDMDSSSCSYVQFNPGGGNPNSVPRKVPHTLHYKDDPAAHDYSYPSFDSSPSATSQKHSRSPSFPSPPPKRPASIEGLKTQYRPRFPSPQQPQLPIKSSKKREFTTSKKSCSRRDKQNRSLLHSSGVSNQRAQCKYCDETFTIGDNPRGACKDAPDTSLKCINYVSCLVCARCMLYHCVSKEENWDDPYDCDNVDDELQCCKWSVLTCLTIFVPCLWCYFLLRACHKCGSSCGCCGARHKSSS